MGDTRTVVAELQKLLAGTHVFLQNVRGYHWNIVGGTFFFLHSAFGDLYDSLAADADKIAERIRALGAYPVTKYSKYIETSAIKEAEFTNKDAKMIYEIVQDLKKTIQQMYAVQQIATQVNDQATMNMIADMLEQTEKTFWMYSSSQKVDLMSSLNIAKNK